MGLDLSLLHTGRDMLLLPNGGRPRHTRDILNQDTHSRDTRPKDIPNRDTERLSPSNRLQVLKSVASTAPDSWTQAPKHVRPAVHTSNNFF